MKKIDKILVANRSEIAIRVMRAAAELDIASVAIYSEEDRFALHRFKAAEAYRIGKDCSPVQAYLQIDEIVQIAVRSGADAVHPGYGFLSESPDFARACISAGLVFIGPSPEVMRRLGNKVQARALAQENHLPVMPATDALPSDSAVVRAQANAIGYPLMLKASWGGGGRGMRVIESDAELDVIVDIGRREADTAFGNDEVYLEKLVRRARHVEVQVLGDQQGNLVHLFERDCTVQRRNQKVVERAPAFFLTDSERETICEAALRLCRGVGYYNAGTVEFLQDADSGEFYFIEVNPRIQVEHTVTEEITGIDIVKAQIRIAQGCTIGADESGVPPQQKILLRGHAMQCRITTEDPENNFIPDYGEVDTYRSPSGFGIRLDAGTAYSGARVTRHYDSLLVKVTSRGNTPEEVIQRMLRALHEFRVRGVNTNMPFLIGLLSNEDFRRADYTTRFIDNTPDLMSFPRRRDRVTRLLRFIGDITVNGNPTVKGRRVPQSPRVPRVPPVGEQPLLPGSCDRLAELGPQGFARWMLDQPQALITDTTFRDAHQSLLATRVRSYDLIAVADAYARMLPQLLSVECWGGATFDVAMRFLNECPWQRLAALRERMPNILTQMLLRASNAVGYTNYPDNVVQHFVAQAAAGGVDVFRIFDSLNWVENMRVAIDAAGETGKLVEGAICFTGNLSDPQCSKYNLDYYLNLARQLEAAGSHILGLKDMGGLCRPQAARDLIGALKSEVSIPIHFHTHDTSGIAGASVLAAVEAGVDAVDCAMDAMSGLTSQPNLGSIVEALRHGPRDTGLDADAIRELSRYWEAVRENYTAFEGEERSGASEVYVHGMPGGQYTNLREQARSLGLADRWSEVAHAYAQVNDLFGDIIKVTPTSKVVGDMALMMVTNGLTRQNIEDPDYAVAFPESVVSLFRGDIGQPYGGFPEALQKKILGGEAPLTKRPGEILPPADLNVMREEGEQQIERPLSDAELASYLMYPQVFTDYAQSRRQYGDMTVVPTQVFFYGMESGQEIDIELETGNTQIIRFLGLSEHHDDGLRTVFFEVNGQPRQINVADRAYEVSRPTQPKADPADPGQVGAPMPGLIVQINVASGDTVQAGEVLMIIEAMKMQTSVRAECDSTVGTVKVEPGQQVDVKDLLLEFD
ncbi:MAG: pyruvate carboxylase [Arenicellales bacterium]|jgi:pyruvate carboxylase|nr:pyruvate carboxylase [Arenicellales bacterium]